MDRNSSDSSIFNVFYIILFLIIVYYYRYYRYDVYNTIKEDYNNDENMKNNKEYDKNDKEENNLQKDILHDSFFLETPKGFINGGIVKDYGGMIEYKYADILTDKPDNIDEIMNIVKKAKEKKKKIRIRGGGHSCSGISIPKKDEIFIDMRRMYHYSFDKVNTITVESGIAMNDLKRFLENEGFKIPIYPHGVNLLDKTSPTVGGFISAGGISPDSKEYGGFWENVVEITLIDGYGEKRVFTPDNTIFMWLFGSYGQFGIIISAKLKIEHIQKNKDFYPLGKKGIVDAFKYKLGDRKSFFYHILCDKEKVEYSKNKLTEIIQKEYDSVRDIRNFNLNIYFVKYKNFNPPLLYRHKSFYCVEVYQYLNSKNNIYKEKLKRIENEFLKIIEDNSLFRYPQSEYLDTLGLKDYYINRQVYHEFLIQKEKLDPDNIFNPIDNFSTL